MQRGNGVALCGGPQGCLLLEFHAGPCIFPLLGRRQRRTPSGEATDASNPAASTPPRALASKPIAATVANERTTADEAAVAPSGTGKATGEATVARTKPPAVAATLPSPDTHTCPPAKGDKIEVLWGNEYFEGAIMSSRVVDGARLHRVMYGAIRDWPAQAHYHDLRQEVWRRATKAAGKRRGGGYNCGKCGGKKSEQVARLLGITSCSCKSKLILHSRPDGEVVTEADGYQLHLSSLNETGYKGVTIGKTSFVATCNGNYLGVAPTAVEAAVLYAACVQHHHEQEWEPGDDELDRPETDPSYGITAAVGTDGTSGTRRRFWTAKEKGRFMEAARRAGWADVPSMQAHVDAHGWVELLETCTRHVATRSRSQVRTFAQKLMDRYRDEHPSACGEGVDRGSLECVHCHRVFKARGATVLHQRACEANPDAGAAQSAEAIEEAREARQQAAEEGLPLIPCHWGRTTAFKQYQGVDEMKVGHRKKKYVARGEVDGRMRTLGRFWSPEGAALCYARHLGKAKVRLATELKHASYETPAAL